MKQAEVKIVSDSREVAQLIQPLRARMLELLMEPDSSAGLARKMQMPRQQVNYHLRELEKTGLVVQVAERRKRHLLERIVQATARTYVISPEVLGEHRQPDANRDRFSLAHLIAAAGRILRDLATIKKSATASGKRIATLTIENEIRFSDGEQRHIFAEELATSVATLTTKYHQDEGQGLLFRLVIGCYPAITKADDGGDRPSSKEVSEQLNLPLK